MVSKSFAIALAASTLAAAQTKSLCDPTAGDTCPPNPAFGECKKKVHEFDFSKVGSGDGWRKDSGFNDWWIPDGGVLVDDSPLSIDPALGAVLTITKPEQAPLIRSKKYILFGKVEVVVQAAPGQGIVTSIVLESDNRDEIDWEWVGAAQQSVQTNFFSKGVNDFTHGKTHGISFNAMSGQHTYTIEWTKDLLTFSVDGQVLRTATPAEADNGAKWPQTPCMIKLGTWVGGKTAFPQGTIDWAGGLADFAKAPFIGSYKSIKVTDYCNDASEAGEYVYGDKSGSLGSILINGQKSENKDSSSSSASSTAAPTESKTGSTSSPTDKSSNGNGDKTGTANNPSQTTDAPGAAAMIKVSTSLVCAVFFGFLLLA